MEHIEISKNVENIKKILIQAAGIANFEKEGFCKNLIKNDGDLARVDFAHDEINEESLATVTSNIFQSVVGVNGEDRVVEWAEANELYKNVKFLAVYDCKKDGKFDPEKKDNVHREVFFLNENELCHMKYCEENGDSWVKEVVGLNNMEDIVKGNIEQQKPFLNTHNHTSVMGAYLGTIFDTDKSGPVANNKFFQFCPIRDAGKCVAGNIGMCGFSNLCDSAGTPIRDTRVKKQELTPINYGMGNTEGDNYLSDENKPFEKLFEKLYKNHTVFSDNGANEDGAWARGSDDAAVQPDKFRPWHQTKFSLLLFKYHLKDFYTNVSIHTETSFPNNAQINLYVMNVIWHLTLYFCIKSFRNTPPGLVKAIQYLRCVRFTSFDKSPGVGGTQTTEALFYKLDFSNTYVIGEGELNNMFNQLDEKYTKPFLVGGANSGEQQWTITQGMCATMLVELLGDNSGAIEPRKGDSKIDPKTLHLFKYLKPSSSSGGESPAIVLILQLLKFLGDTSHLVQTILQWWALKSLSEDNENHLQIRDWARGKISILTTLERILSIRMLKILENNALAHTEQGDKFDKNISVMFDVTKHIQEICPKCKLLVTELKKLCAKSGINHEKSLHYFGIYSKPEPQLYSEILKKEIAAFESLFRKLATQLKSTPELPKEVDRPKVIQEAGKIIKAARNVEKSVLQWEEQPEANQQNEDMDEAGWREQIEAWLKRLKKTNSLLQSYLESLNDFTKFKNLDENDWYKKFMRDLVNLLVMLFYSHVVKQSSHEHLFITKSQSNLANEFELPQVALYLFNVLKNDSIYKLCLKYIKLERDLKPAEVGAMQAPEGAYALMPEAEEADAMMQEPEEAAESEVASAEEALEAADAAGADAVMQDAEAADALMQEAMHISAIVEQILTADSVAVEPDTMNAEGTYAEEALEGVKSATKIIQGTVLKMIIDWHKEANNHRLNPNTDNHSYMQTFIDDDERYPDALDCFKCTKKRICVIPKKSGKTTKSWDVKTVPQSVNLLQQTNSFLLISKWSDHLPNESHYHPDSWQYKVIKKAKIDYKKAIKEPFAFSILTFMTATMLTYDEYPWDWLNDNTKKSLRELKDILENFIPFFQEWERFMYLGYTGRIFHHCVNIFKSLPGEATNICKAILSHLDDFELTEIFTNYILKHMPAELTAEFDPDQLPTMSKNDKIDRAITVIQAASKLENPHHHVGGSKKKWITKKKNDNKKKKEFKKSLSIKWRNEFISKCRK